MTNLMSPSFEGNRKLVASEVVWTAEDVTPSIGDRALHEVSPIPFSVLKERRKARNPIG